MLEVIVAIVTIDDCQMFMIYIAGNSCVTYNQPTMTSPDMQKGVSTVTISFTPRYSFSRKVKRGANPAIVQ